MGRHQPQGFTRVPRAGPGCNGLRLVSRTTRGQASGCEGANRLWRSGRRGNHQGLSRRHFPRRVHVALCRDGLCPARLPEEVEERTGNAAPGHGVDPATTARSRTDCQGEKAMSNKKRNGTGSRNVFKDIGVPNAEEHLVKAQLVFKIDALLKARGLKQVEAAELFGIRQPDVSKMLRGEFRQFSV